MSKLSSIAPPLPITVTLGGQEIKIKPLVMRDLASLCAKYPAFEKWMGQLTAGLTISYAEMIEQVGIDFTLDFIAGSLGCERVELESLLPTDIVFLWGRCFDLSFTFRGIDPREKIEPPEEG